jgi:hypothetical protein
MKNGKAVCVAAAPDLEWLQQQCCCKVLEKLCGSTFLPAFNHRHHSMQAQYAWGKTFSGTSRHHHCMLAQNTSNERPNQAD